MSENGIDDEKSMLALTWEELINLKKQDTAYLLYNDGEPKGGSGKTSAGHLKGMVAFDKDTGIWITHSIPKCCNSDKYKYPKTAMTYGQTAMCMTFEASSFKDICQHLLYCSPNNYDYNLSDRKKSELENDTQSLFSGKVESIKEEPYQKTTKLKTKGGMELTVFAKNENLEEDIYSYVLIQELDCNLIANTWVKGPGGVLDPYCDDKKQVVDVETLEVEGNEFSTKQDHSKWAISQDSSKPFVCIGDLNRMKSQGKRGGGAVCFESKQVRDAFEKVIKESKDC